MRNNFKIKNVVTVLASVYMMSMVSYVMAEDAIQLDGSATNAVVMDQATVTPDAVTAPRVQLPMGDANIGNRSSVMNRTDLLKARADELKAEAELLKAEKDLENIRNPKVEVKVDEKALGVSSAMSQPILSGPAAVASPIKPRMYVKTTYGVEGGDMRAEIELSNGEPLTVMVGDRLTETEEIKSISGKGVTVYNKKTKKSKLYNVTLDRSINAQSANSATSNGLNVPAGLLPPPTGLPNFGR